MVSFEDVKVGSLYRVLLFSNERDLAPGDLIFVISVEQQYGMRTIFLVEALTKLGRRLVWLSPLEIEQLDKK